MAKRGTTRAAKAAARVGAGLPKRSLAATMLLLPQFGRRREMDPAMRYERKPRNNDRLAR